MAHHIAAFAVAHTLTLTIAAFGAAPASTWFATLIGMLIAFSIVYVAIENGVGAGFKHRWIVAFVFGIVHGFGFAFEFRDVLQFAGGHPVAALLSFNIGVEIGQLAFVSLVLALIWAHHRLKAELPRWGEVLPAYAIGRSGWPAPSPAGCCSP